VKIQMILTVIATSFTDVGQIHDIFYKEKEANVIKRTYRHSSNPTITRKKWEQRLLGMYMA
jgi:hypothetical protein